MADQQSAQDPAQKAASTRDTMPGSSDRQRFTLTLPGLAARSLSTAARNYSDQIVTHVAVNVNGWNTFPKSVYNMLATQSVALLPINEVNFVRMCKTFLLKRLMDIYEWQHASRPDGYIRLGRHVGLPAPITDVLYSIGTFKSVYTGAFWMPDMPIRAAPPQTFWTVDTEIISQWMIETMAQVEGSYTIREYPSPAETTGRPFITTRKITDGDLVRVKIHTNETTPAEVYLRAINDPILTGQPDNMTRMIAMDYMETTIMRGEYLRGYCLRNFEMLK